MQSVADALVWVFAGGAVAAYTGLIVALFLTAVRHWWEMKGAGISARIPQDRPIPVERVTSACSGTLRKRGHWLRILVPIHLHWLP